VTTTETLGRALAAAPDPELARVALSRIGESPVAREWLAQPGLAEATVPLLGFSSAASDFLVAHPEELALFADLAPRSRDDLLREVEADVAAHGPEAGLRRFRRRALTRVAARDLGGADLTEILAEVTAVAEACLQAGVRQVGGGLAVIGMGKLGGAELNYASDVDVIFVHEESGTEAQAEGARRAASLVRLLSEPTAEGRALRVDVDLRPEGRSGALSRSLGATLEYYRHHAATWERQAWLKARPVAGAIVLGRKVLRGLEPLVYPEHLDPSAIEDVRAMKARIEEYVRAMGKEASEVKRGRGGIRDVEFAVQLLQLVHGRRDPELRHPGTLDALEALAERGYVARADAETLAGSYRFLRALEHRLQLARELQTHQLPTDEASLRRLARSMGLGDVDALHQAYGQHTGVVRGLHERLFYRPLLEAFAGERSPLPGRDPAATVELLAGLGFADPAAAYERFEGLVGAPTRLGSVLTHVFPVIAPAVALASDPDASLVRFARVLESVGDDERIADEIATDPQAGVRLARTVAASSWAADVLASDGDAWRRLQGGHRANGPPDLLTVVGAYASGVMAVPEVGRELARLGDAAVADALERAEPTVPFAVIGLGKLGAEELNFASDLDLVFVYEGEGPEAFTEGSRVGERVLAGVTAAGFEADADLRPEGKNGPLARSMAAYLEYWQGWARTWEFQALLKARFVAGDELLGKRFVLAAEDAAYAETLPIERVAEIRRMRVRMEEERVRPPDARRFHFKLGRGGLADVQFAVELSQLRHGFDRPAIRSRHTLEALEALARERLVEDSVSLALGEAYVFLNEVKNALEIDRRVRAEAIPPSAEAQRALARRLGYEEYPRAAFLEDYRRITRRARQAMERVFYGEDEE
jgi:glutamate-ammonia-ligase adenylyltransferase